MPATKDEIALTFIDDGSGVADVADAPAALVHTRPC